MLTSPIKPPLPSPTLPLALGVPSPFSLPACHLNHSTAPSAKPPAVNPRLLRCSSRDSPAATALSAAQPILRRVSRTCVHYQKIREEPTLLSAACCNASRNPLCYVTDVSRGWPRKPVLPRSSVLIRTFILPVCSHVKSYVNI